MIIVFPLSVRPHFSKSNKTKQISSQKQYSLLARLWCWPNGSLVTPVLFSFLFFRERKMNLKVANIYFYLSIHISGHKSHCAPLKKYCLYDISMVNIKGLMYLHCSLTSLMVVPTPWTEIKTIIGHEGSDKWANTLLCIGIFSPNLDALPLYWYA